jgi:sigma-E factor negative regulatory protein RseA
MDMTADPSHRDAAFERLSALADGELDEAATAQACAMWRDDASLRVTWHRYQLIGDVLRSDDLVSTGTKDSAFLSALRARLADEPVVLAPQALVAELEAVDERQQANGARVLRRRRWTWIAPSAVAAGFVAVAGVMVVLRNPAPGGVPPVPTLATTGPGLRMTAPGLLPASAMMFGPRAATGGAVIRDPRLDRYLAAHKEFAGSPALGLSPMYLRSASVEVPSR